MSTELSELLLGPIVASGRWVTGRGRALVSAVDFLGATLIGMSRLRRGTLQARSAFQLALQQYGAESLPVVGLIALAGGAILTLLGLKELGKVGVDGMAPRVVGIVLLREIGPLITGIALAGRVAASCAAEMTAARAGGETARLRDAGLEPVGELVAPRVLALVLAGPLLVAYADGLALLGSWAYAKYAMHRPGLTHLLEVWSGLTLKHALAALAKGAGFGLVVGLAGCYHGLRAGADGVGARVRAAVVAAAIAVGLTETALIFVFKWIRF